MASKGGDLIEEDQEQFLGQATNVVRQQAFHMKRAIDQENTKEALKHAATMLCELRTGLLSPKNYYELYMMIFDELRHISQYFEELVREGKKQVTDLYELVQHAGNVLPRLYLLVTVGGVYISLQPTSAKDILRDLVEMCKGVQHPMRGLFLRNYLSHVCKDKLPDTGSPFHGEGGSVDDAVDFVQQNFAEMNRLWVRMQHQSRGRARAKREAERQDLRILVGTNLVRISQLDGVDLPFYTKSVLPRVLEQVVGCKDRIAQQYLMDCIVQVFPDDYHLNTLETLLQTCTELHEQVDVRSIMVTFMDRLAAYADARVQEGTPRDEAIPPSVAAFDLFSTYSAKVVEAGKGAMDTKDILGLEVSLLGFGLKCYPDRPHYVNGVLEFCATLLDKVTGGKVDADCVPALAQLLSVPIEEMGLNVFSLEAYPKLANFLQWDQRRDMALRLVQRIISGGGEGLDNLDTVKALFAFIGPLVADQEDGPSEDEEDHEEFVRAQHLVASLVPMMHSGDTDAHMAILQAAAATFQKGKARRIQYTLPPLVFATLRLVARVREREGTEDAPKVKTRKVFQFAHKMCTALATSYPQTALRLFLQAAQAASNLGEKEIAYEFMTQACILYEDTADSRQQVEAVSLIVATLHAVAVFEEETYAELAKRATQYSAKLLRKPDQCRMVQQCSHLFWVQREGGYRDDKRVLECLQRALKIADACMSSSVHVQLFVDILNEYLYFFEHKNPAIAVKYLTGLLGLINEHLENMDDEEGKASVTAQYKNTLDHIRRKQAGEDGARYAEITA